MIIVLNFCHIDRDLAWKLLRRIGELGPQKRHELILQSNITAAANGLVSDLEATALEIFGSVKIRVTDTNEERGWPYSPNNAWLEMVNHIRVKVKKPWLWLEPDCVLLTADGFDRIEDEFAAIAKDKAFMGAEVTRPQHRMSGVGVYPPWVAQFTRGLPALSDNKAPWDQVLARDFNPFVHFTTLIQNVWNKVIGDPTTAPTFPDQQSLELIDPRAVIFHRCKDGSLIDRLNEKSSVTALPASASEQSGDTVYTIPSLMPAAPAGIGMADKADPNAALLASALSRIQELELLVKRQALTECASDKSLKINKTFAASGNKAKKAKRTPEAQAIIDARMAKARAARKPKLTGVL